MPKLLPPKQIYICLQGQVFNFAPSDLHAKMTTFWQSQDNITTTNNWLHGGGPPSRRVEVCGDETPPRFVQEPYCERGIDAALRAGQRRHGGRDDSLKRSVYIYKWLYYNLML